MCRLAPNTAWIHKHGLDVSVDRLKPYTANDADIAADIQPPPQADLSMPGDAHAEFVMLSDEEEVDEADFQQNQIPQPAAIPLPPQQPPPVVGPPPPPPPAAAAAAAAPDVADADDHGDDLHFGTPPDSPPPRHRYDGYTAAERLRAAIANTEAAARRARQAGDRANRAARRQD